MLSGCSVGSAEGSGEEVGSGLPLGSGEREGSGWLLSSVSSLGGISEVTVSSDADSTAKAEKGRPLMHSITARINANERFTIFCIYLSFLVISFITLKIG